MTVLHGETKHDHANGGSDTWDTVHRVIFPDQGDSSLWPLYVDWGQAPSSAVSAGPLAGSSQLKVARAIHRAPQRFSRRSLVIPAGERLSLATYFNAFPAAYWQRWTDAKEVRLTLELRGAAEVEIIRSSARGTFTKVDGAETEGLLQFTVPLNRFGDGGWIWPEIVASAEDVELVHAEWSVPASGKSGKTRATVAITTYNMPDDCVAQLRRFIAAPDVRERLAEIIIVDQGSKNVADAVGYTEAADALGSQFRIITQDNLGGSGGFSRGMYETLRNPESDYVLLLDDDAVVEPEGVLRSIQFADHSSRPMIVGGHMLNLHERTILHSFGERVNEFTFWWDSANEDLKGIDLSQETIRTTPALNRRVDVSYNGWWMCLIPKSIISEVGLSLPFFIKWDDAEYGLRAAEHGFLTVSLPGAAVWHVPWTEKDDGLDWQAYFHQRNRWVTALLHSSYTAGGVFPRKSLATDVKHILSLQYYPASLRITALEDVLRGPDHLQPSIKTRASQARTLAKQFDDARLLRNPEEYPSVKRMRPLPNGQEPTPPRNAVSFATKAVTGALRQLRRDSLATRQHPEASISNSDAKWWRLANLDSALVSNAEGSGVWFYKRDRSKFVESMKRSLALHARLRTEWETLAARYRSALPRVTSVEAWKKTFGIDD